MDLNIRVEELPAVFDNLVREVMKDHERRFRERARAVKDASSALDSTASRFEAAVKNAWGTMDKSASEYGTRMAQTIEELTRTLSRKQTSETYNETDGFHKESIDTLNRIVRAVRKYVPKLRRGLRVEMAALNVALGKLEMAIKSLGSALDQSPGSKVEPIRRDILHLVQLHADFLKLRARGAEDTKRLESEKLRERDAGSKVDAFTSKDMFLELRRYESALKANEDEITRFLQPTIKPLSKLERTAAADKSQSTNLESLRDLVERPVETVTEAQSFVLIQLFDQLEIALTQGRIEIEERRRRRAEETIEQVRHGALQRLRADRMTIQANVQETLRQLKANGLLDEKQELAQNLSSIQHETTKLTDDIVDVTRRLETLATAISKEKTSLEEQIAKLTDTQIVIESELSDPSLTGID